MHLVKSARSLALLIVGVGVAVNSYSQSFLTNGLVAYYPFNGNANDASGNGNNGTTTGVMQATNRFGIAGSANQFDGSNAVITVAPLSSANLPELTLSVWVQPFAHPVVQGDIINKWRAFSYGLEDYGLLLYSDLRVSFGNGRHATCYGTVPNNCGLSSTNQLSLGQWYNLVVTLDSAGTGKLWINGILSAQDNILPLLTPSTEPVRIGQMLYTANSPFNGAIVESFNGLIDDVRIYSRALSDNEVAQLYAVESSFCSPHKAIANAQLVNGFVVGATITDAGCGYTNAPTVLIQGGGGTGATATATISGGQVAAINIISAGCCYTNAPKIVIGSPPFVPTVSIAVSKVKVTQNVVLGLRYVLESTTDFITWTPVGPPFISDSETIVTEFDVDLTSRFFRIRQVL